MLTVNFTAEPSDKEMTLCTIPLSDGSAVKLTVSKYYTPNGNDIHGKGIEPDVVVEFNADDYYDKGIDNQLQEAIKYLSDYMTK